MSLSKRLWKELEEKYGGELTEEEAYEALLNEADFGERKLLIELGVLETY